MKLFISGSILVTLHTINLEFIRQYPGVKRSKASAGCCQAQSVVEKVAKVARPQFARGTSAGTPDLQNSYGPIFRKTLKTHTTN